MLHTNHTALKHSNVGVKNLLEHLSLESLAYRSPRWSRYSFVSLPIVKISQASVMEPRSTS